VETTIEELIPGASGAALFEQVATLDRYPPWMRLVHRVEPLAADDGRPAWWVELRARVGPFARSKQLRPRDLLRWSSVPVDPAEERYRLGSGTVLELSDALNAVTRADAAYINAVYDNHRALVALFASIGRDYPNARNL
jgi:hypothetical protein